MLYADTDFFIALLKEKDWLNKKARNIYQKNKGNIRTSISVILEVAIICRRMNIDTEKAIVDICNIVNLKQEEKQISLTAAYYISHYKMTPFDAFNAASAGEDPIISSDSVYDGLGLQRIKLES